MVEGGMEGGGKLTKKNWAEKREKDKMEGKKMSVHTVSTGRVQRYRREEGKKTLKSGRSLRT